MFVNSIKTFLAVGIVAVGAAISTTSTANASSSFGIYIGNGHGGGINYGHRSGGHYGKHHGKYRGHGYKNHGYKRSGYGQQRGCGPHQALNKAFQFGVNHPHIARINHNKIVVVGYSRGHQAQVVFKRKGHGCRVVKTRGLY